MPIMDLRLRGDDGFVRQGDGTVLGGYGIAHGDNGC